MTKPESKNGLRSILLLLAFGIVYGSLYPFDFATSAATSVRIAALWGGHWSSSRGDILSNIALFMPLGLVAALAKPQQRWLLSITMTLIFAHIIQLLQIWLPARDPSLLDTLLNGAGFGAGILCYVVFQDKIKSLLSQKSELQHINLPALITVLFWLLAYILPFVPTLDFQNVKNVAKAIMSAQNTSGQNILYHAAGWFAFTAICRRFAVLPNLWLASLIFVGCVAVQPFLRQATFDQSQLVGGVAGLALGYLFNKPSLNKKSFGPAVMLTLILLVEGLWPGSGSSTSFNPLPMHSYLDGNLLANSRSIIRRIYFASAMLLLWQGASKSFLSGVVVTTVVAIITLLGRAAFDLDRSIDLADLLWPTLAAVFLRALMTKAGAATQAIEPQVRQMESRAVSGKLSSGIKIGALIAAVTAVFYIIVGLPGVSYNVRDLFAGRNSLFACLLLATALVVLASTSAITVALVKQRGRRLFWFPAMISVGVLLGYWLLQNAVSGESLYDVLGSPTIHRDFAGRNSIVHAAGFYLTTNIEMFIRFLALVMPLFLWLAIWLLIAQFDLTTSRGQKNAGFTGIFALLIASPFFILSRLITIEGTATDNIVELIEPGRGLLLFIFMALIAFVAAALSVLRTRQITSWLRAICIFVFGAAAGWFLLRFGLVQQLQKYGLTYSGVQFLFGPDRIATLSDTALCLRWSAAYSAIIAGLALASRWAAQLVNNPDLAAATSRPAQN
jgi:VanZ family protein